MSNSEKAIAAPQTSYHHGNLASAVLDEALAKLASQRHADFSLSDLARSVGVTPAAVYKHFEDKAALLQALVNVGFEQLAAEFEKVAPIAATCRNQSQAVKQLEAVGRAYFQFGVNSPALFQLMFGEAGAPARMNLMRQQKTSTTFAYLERALSDLARFNKIAESPSPERLWFAWCAIHGATQLAIANAAKTLQPKDPSVKIAALIIRALKV